MSTDQNDLLESVLDKTATILDRVAPDQRDLPTPCPNFDVAAEAGHMLGWVAFFATSAEGKETGRRPEWGHRGRRRRQAVPRVGGSRRGGVPRRRGRPVFGADPGRDARPAGCSA